MTKRRIYVEYTTVLSYQEVGPYGAIVEVYPPVHISESGKVDGTEWHKIDSVRTLLLESVIESLTPDRHKTVNVKRLCVLPAQNNSGNRPIVVSEKDIRTWTTTTVTVFEGLEHGS